MANAPTKPTRAIAMAKKCHECCGKYFDGKFDCGVPGCPLYPWMPYKEKEPDLKWLHFNPKRVGDVLWEESSREMSEKERQAAAERLQKSREKRQEEEEGPKRKLKRRI